MLYLIRTDQENKIFTIFKNRNIFSSHANYITDWHQDKKNTAYKKRIRKEVEDEVDRFLRESQNW